VGPEALGAEGLLGLLQGAFAVALAVSLPFLIVGALVGVVVSLLQSVTQVQDATVAHLAKLVALAAYFMVAAPWAAREVSHFALRALGGE
jgi:flagellar biosynthetic protein FliQ